VKHHKERGVADTQVEADWILKTMMAVAASDGRLDEREIGLIQQVYQDQTERALTADEIARAAETNAKGDPLAEFAAAARGLDQNIKEKMIRAAYLVLLADDRIAGEERKKLKDIAPPCKFPRSISARSWRISPSGSRGREADAQSSKGFRAATLPRFASGGIIVSSSQRLFLKAISDIFQMRRPAFRRKMRCRSYCPGCVL
jgi:tellurite resistance protein